MVEYNPKSWWKLIFILHKSDTLQKLKSPMLGILFFTTILAFIETKVLKLEPFKNALVVHSLVGFVLSVLLVFRTNTAYDRWWEGRRLWGSIVNNSRNLYLKLSILLEDNSSKELFRVLITNWAWSAKEHLRGHPNVNILEIMDKYDSSFFREASHLPNRIMQIIYLELENRVKDGKISREQMLFINLELQSFLDNLGGCERILRTPIPYSYSLFIKKFIFLYVITMPIGFVLEYGFFAGPIVALVFYVFASIEILAEEIENPFGNDTNDLPLNQICKTIRENLIEIENHSKK